jgi:hypothetical protein
VLLLSASNACDDDDSGTGIDTGADVAGASHCEVPVAALK